MPLRKALPRALSIEGALSLCRSRAEKGLKDIPGPRPSLPLIGTGWQYFPGGRYSLSNMHEASVDKFRRYGPVVREEFQWRHPVVHLFDPRDFETVFRLQGSHPLRPISEFLKHYRLSNPDKYDTPGLANSCGEEWSRLRSVLNPVLRQMITLEGMVEDINHICDDFVAVLRAGRDPRTHRVDNLQDFVYRLALEAVYMLSLDVRLGCLEPELRPDTDAAAMISSVKLLFEAFQELFYGLPLWKFVQTQSYKKLDKAESTMYDATHRRIQAAMEECRSGRNKPSVLQSFIQNKDLTDKEIRVTVIDFISGGIFTVTNAFSFLLYHLSRNPIVQQNLHRELTAVMPDGVVTGSRLGQMRYLQACVLESFRLTPTIPTITRILPEDIVLSGYHIPAGVPLFCNFTVPCMQEKHFSDTERFMPERWLNKTPLSKFLLMPFGYGSRMCVGRRFAETEMYSALAKLVYNFKLEWSGNPVKCKQAFIVVPSEPISIVFKDR